MSEKINSLLPGAGAAGLSSSYYEAKMRYATRNDVLSNSEDVARFRMKWPAFMPQRMAYLFNLLLFLLPLGVSFYSVCPF